MINSQRFLIKELTISDVTEEYLNWLKYDSEILDQIQGASALLTISNLKAYVKKNTEDNNVLFFGIFIKDSQKHIGNIKFDPINVKDSFAIMGILIGDKEWRAKGVFSEIILVIGKWLFKKFRINVIALAVDKNNYFAIRAYEKSGFIFENHKFFYENSEFNSPNLRSMILRLEL